MTTLIEAAAAGDLALIEEALAAGGDIEERDAEGDTAITIAAARGHASAVALLLKRGADINTKCNAGNSALHSSAAAGHLDVVECLLANGAEKDVKNRRGRTPLLLASMRGYENIIFALLQEGADPNLANDNGDTILMAAANRDMLNIVCTLLDAGVDPNVANKKGQTALALAANQGAVRCVKRLLDAGANDFSSALMLAMLGRQPATMELLLTAGADPNKPCKVEEMTSSLAPLFVALATDNYECARLLLAAGAVFTKMCVWRVAEDGAEIENDIALLMTQVSNDRVAGRPSALPILQEQIPSLLDFALLWLSENANKVAQIVISNHVGVARRRDEEKLAQDRCVREIAMLIANGHPDLELYEDDVCATAMAEFVLSNIRYRQLIEIGRQSPVGLHRGGAGDGLGYEDVCRNELASRDFIVRKTPSTGDQGADLLATKDGITYAIQCKNYAGSVGNSAVQEAISAKQYYKTDHAVVVSDGKFTTSARELAARTDVVLCKKGGIGNIDIICATRV